MERYIDLHTHSNYSDGTDSPEMLVRNAKAAGLCAVALTDHDTVAGLDEFTLFGRECGVEAIHGIEISTQMLDIEVHILGYYINKESELIKAFSEQQAKSRNEKNNRILARLREMGMSITEDDFGGSKGIITRGSIAGVMFDKGFVSSKREAFDKYIGKGKPAYADRVRIGVREAVELILECGGIPVMAHPYLYKLGDSEFEREIRGLAGAGLRGIELLYPDGYRRARELFFRQLAERFSLLVTGGSDYHGDNKTVKLGRVFNEERIPYNVLETLTALI